MEKMKHPTDFCFDDMTEICNYLGGASQNELSSLAHEDRFSLRPSNDLRIT